MENFIYARSFRDLLVYKQSIRYFSLGMMGKAEPFCPAPRIAEDTPVAETLAAEDPLTLDW